MENSAKVVCVAYHAMKACKGFREILRAKEGKRDMSENG
jgi:hypothetical protein